MIPTEILVAAIAACGSCLVALINVIYTRLDKRERKEFETLRAEKESRDARERLDREQRIDDTLIDLNDQSKALSEGVRSILRHEIIELHRTYTDQQYMTLEQSEYLDDTYQAYTGLGGNHLAGRLYDELQQLPIREEL